MPRGTLRRPRHQVPGHPDAAQGGGNVHVDAARDFVVYEVPEGADGQVENPPGAVGVVPPAGVVVRHQHPVAVPHGGGVGHGGIVAGNGAVLPAQVHGANPRGDRQNGDRGNVLEELADAIRNRE